MRRALIVVMVTAFSLGGCQSIAAYEKGVVEPAVDRAYDAAIKRWCHAPADVQVRAIMRKTITPRSLVDNCPVWRTIRDTMLSEMLTRDFLSDFEFKSDTRIAPVIPE